jgi:hypothetical protein
LEPPGGPVVFLVFPDLGGAKGEALCRLAGEGLRVNVLLSYATILAKPSTTRRLGELRRRGCLGAVMLDSGAYHVAFRGLRLGVGEYARGALGLSGLVDLVVGPDVPRDPRASLERLAAFSRAYPHPFIPTLQSSGPPEGYLESLRMLEEAGIIDRAPRVGGEPLVGIGGLVGMPTSYGVEAVRLVSGSCGCRLHIFGASLRLLTALRRRGLLGALHSIDTSGWLAEIRWRRRSLYHASTTLEANMAAMRGYIAKIPRGP